MAEFAVGFDKAVFAFQEQRCDSQWKLRIFHPALLKQHIKEKVRFREEIGTLWGG